MERLLEELSLNAWPSARVMFFDGWAVRFAGGYTRRANSVNLVGPSTLPMEDKVEFCESLYRLAGQKAIFKIYPDPEAEELDRFLSKRGYEVEGGADVMTCKLDSQSPDAAVDFRIEADLTDWWYGAAERLNELDVHSHRHLEQILHNIQPIHVFASVRDGAQPIALGLAVLERKWMGIYDVVASKPFRRQGFGRHLVQHMMAWGHQNGAENAYLQVVTQNAPAIALYRSLGFERQYAYWYRVKA